MSGEKAIFKPSLQAARRRVVATLQSIIMYEFLPAFVGREATDYDGYKSFIHPGISHVFQSAAFRRVERTPTG